jgi:hypothetical protein
MGKLRLNLDQLSVDSFDTASPVKEKGTVFGEQECTCPTICSCPGCPTCDYTCDDLTCPATCFGSCGGSCYYTECGGNTIDAHTCNPTNGGGPQECCPY